MRVSTDCDFACLSLTDGDRNNQEKDRSGRRGMTGPIPFALRKVVFPPKEVLRHPLLSQALAQGVSFGLRFVRADDARQATPEALREFALEVRIAENQRRGTAGAVLASPGSGHERG